MFNFIPTFWRAIVVLIIAYLVLTNAFPPLLPKTLLIQYMVIILVGVLLYYSFNEERWNDFKKPITNVLTKKSHFVLRWFYLLAIPTLVAFTVYGMVKPSFDAPVELRQVHPAPPSKLKVFNKSFNLTTLENPIRSKVVAKLVNKREEALTIYNEAVSAGKDTYYKNCFYCHGDLLDGDGMYGKGFNPLPINFQDVGTIAQLQEGFLFWRIATGGPGLPKEGTPWKSAMPVWHEMIDENQIWEVITFIYDYIGQVPRIWDSEISRIVTGLKDEINTKRATLMGKELYQLRCEQCHGEQGMGDGVAAEFLYPKPRDFSLGLLKYKTSPGTELARDEDIKNVIRHGLEGTGMPGWTSLMTEEQIASLVPVIKSFDTTAAWSPEEAEDEDFDDDGRYLKNDLTISNNIEPTQGQEAYTAESLKRGKKVFIKACKECHGNEGRGNITSGKRLEDDWGYRIWPRDLTKAWTYRFSNFTKGKTAKDDTIKAIYERLSIGIPGTPMPAHRASGEGNKDPINLADRWHVANYVYSLRETSASDPGEKTVITAKEVKGALPTAIDDKAWDSAEKVTFRMVPNIIKEPRLFTPLNDSVAVKVMYNKDEIAFLLEVDDRTDSRPGEKVSTQIHDAELKMFADAFAIQLPKQGSFIDSPVVEKPLFRHGDKKHPVTIWYWNAGSVKPEKAAMSALIDANGPDKKLLIRHQDRTLDANGKWKDGQWKVLMKRKRFPSEKSGDIQIEEGKFIPVSFANWDGNNGEKGAKHTLTTWYWLFLPKAIPNSTLYGIPFAAFLIMFIFGLLIVRSAKQPE
jgi:DMSO reductase family type II enzyme heme b subunit